MIREGVGSNNPDSQNRGPRNLGIGATTAVFSVADGMLKFSLKLEQEGPRNLGIGATTFPASP